MSIGVISTDPYHGYAVVFSPFISGKVAIVGGLNFGIAGPGALIIFESSLATGFRESRRYSWKDVLFDVTWSEIQEQILVAASGDGSLLVYDQACPQGPVSVLNGHTAEVM